MAESLSATAVLINGRMKFKGDAGGRTVYTDYVPPYGDNDGFLPLELFLISLSSCMGAALSVFLSKAGKHINTLSVHAEGTRREEHPLCFASIALEVHLASDNTSEDELQKIIQAAEQTYCPLAAMIKNNVELHTQFTLSRE